MNLNIIYNEDCLDTLKKLSDNSIDLLVTDPPYGISFMGKSWDKALPDKQIWVECLRVLKDGAFAFVMSIPRADCLSRMIINLEDAGFNVGFSPLVHCFASGFPKSARLNRNPKFCQCAVVGHNVVNKNQEIPKDDHNGKAVSLEYNDHSQADGQYLNYKPLTSLGDYHPVSPYGELPHHPAKGGQDTAQRQEYAQEHSHSAEHVGGQASESLHNPSQVQYNDHPSNQDYSLPSDSESDIGECNLGNKEVLGDVPTPKDTLKLADHKLDTVFQSSLSNPPIIDYTTGFPLCQVCGKPKADGAYCGAQFKPAWETIIVAMKPLSEKTFVDQALKNKHGVTWLDEGRIPTGESLMGGGYQDRQGTVGTQHCERNVMPKESFKQPAGRFCANLLVSDDVLNDGSNHHSMGNLKLVEDYGHGDKLYGGYAKSPHNKSYFDSGSFSRYFDLDKWFEERIKLLPASVQKTFPFLIVPKANKSEKNKGCEDLKGGYYGYLSNAQRAQLNRGEEVKQDKDRINITKAHNFHPTVKPVRLFSYLITLGSREGDIVLDPFIGSGTTALACITLARNYIGSEINKEYYDIAMKRINNGN